MPAAELATYPPWSSSIYALRSAAPRSGLNARARRPSSPLASMGRLLIQACILAGASARAPPTAALTRLLIARARRPPPREPPLTPAPAGALAAAAAAPKPLGRACEPGCSGDIWGEGTLVNFPTSFERGDGLKDLRAEQIEVPCQCSDVEPRDEYTSAIPATCYQQRVFGNCDQPWM